MEGLDLFSPNLGDESSESSLSEMESDAGQSDSDFEVAPSRPKRKGLTVHISTQGSKERLGGAGSEGIVDVVGEEEVGRDFEIEKVCVGCVSVHCVCIHF